MRELEKQIHVIRDDGKTIPSADGRSALDEIGLRYLTTYFQEHGRRDLVVVGTQADAKAMEPVISCHAEGTKSSTRTNVEGLSALFSER